MFVLQIFSPLFWSQKHTQIKGVSTLCLHTHVPKKGKNVTKSIYFFLVFAVHSSHYFRQLQGFYHVIKTVNNIFEMYISSLQKILIFLLANKRKYVPYIWNMCDICFKDCNNLLDCFGSFGKYLLFNVTFLPYKQLLDFSSQSLSVQGFGSFGGFRAYLSYHSVSFTWFSWGSIHIWKVSHQHSLFIIISLHCI